MAKELPGRVVISRNIAREKFSCGVTKFSEIERDPRFPKAFFIGKTRRFFLDEVDAYIETLAKAPPPTDASACKRRPPNASSRRKVKRRAAT